MSKLDAGVVSRMTEYYRTKGERPTSSYTREELEQRMRDMDATYSHFLRVYEAQKNGRDVLKRSFARVLPHIIADSGGISCSDMPDIQGAVRGTAEDLRARLLGINPGIIRNMVKAAEEAFPMMQLFPDINLVMLEPARM
ncbi:hypothetical protein KIPB_001353 [Kipferlia bialata]|uniref:Uncharacterized protein n=1 Tax=Kipferlia bialata TaxID=797122 RepID=A0A9K3CRX0_9EUKA|nr:hypothetical protein KIPB_001353 [Kipferlia bialata]|eukprot:g1353.t1